MTIKEIEVRSGMTRANIRFYEAEGLLSPARSPNGYRDYSEKDLEVLKKIKLLRALRISLEEIKMLQNEKDDLAHVLDCHMVELEAQRMDIDRSYRVCREIRTDGADYKTLDTQRYLNSLDCTPEKALYADVIPQVRSPWRRFFARTLDNALYSTLWSVFLIFVCNVKIVGRSAAGNILDTFVVMAITLLVEPVLLSLFGTTLGKWILGISVKDCDGVRLTYSGALERTWKAVWRGMGAGIPIYGIVRMWKSYKACKNGEELEWEQDSEMHLRDEKWWRTAAAAVTYGIFVAVIVLAAIVEEMPKHRGDITTAEFSDNYNRLASYYGIDQGAVLDEQGKWIKENDGLTFSLFGETLPEVVIREEEGKVREVSFHYEKVTASLFVLNCQDQMVLSAISFACTQRNIGEFLSYRKVLLGEIEAHHFEDFSVSYNGVTMECTVEKSGYSEAPGSLFFPDGENSYFSMYFNIRKEG